MSTGTWLPTFRGILLSPSSGPKWCFKSLDSDIYSIKLHPNIGNSYESTLRHIRKVFKVYQTLLQLAQLTARQGRRHPCAAPGCRSVFLVYFNREFFGICGAFRKCSRKLDELKIKHKKHFEE
jgi:hypothetical protein